MQTENTNVPATGKSGMDINADFRDESDKFTGKLYKPDIKEPEYMQLVNLGAIVHIDGKETKALGELFRTLIKEKYPTFVPFITKKSANPTAKAEKQASKLAETLRALSPEDRAAILAQINGGQ